MWSEALNGHLKASLSHTISQLLKEKQYERVAQIVYEAQHASQQDGNALLAGVLGAARQISLACGQCRAEEAWHKRAQTDAEYRAHELERLLRSILNLVGEDEPPITPDQPDALLHSSAAGSPVTQHEHSESEERLNLWQRIQNLLGRGTNTWLPNRSVLGISAIPLRHPLVASPEQAASPSLMVYCLGPLRVYQDDKLITMNEVQVLETGGVAPGFIVNAPNTFTIRTTLSNQGGFSGALHGQTGTIAYRAERLDDNTVSSLAVTAFTVPAALTFDVDSALFTSGAGSDLDVGTYMLTAIVTMDSAGLAFVAAFNQILIRIV